MNLETLWWLLPVFFVVACLYSSVGHGGASGYLAVLSFVMIAPDRMATTALTLNILVAGSAVVNYTRAGHLSWRLSWPFLAASIPAAFLGGSLRVNVKVYAALLAVSLCVASVRLLLQAAVAEADGSIEPPKLAVALPAGAGIGWLSGLVGVGGGIFLSPLLLLCRWATAKQTAAASAVFIVVNSAAGLAGRGVRGGLDYGMIWPLLAAAFAGGVLGSSWGARYCSGMWIRRLLGVVLLVAAFKLARMALL